MNDSELHAHLIGQQGGRKAFNTPVLVIDLDMLERNIAAMATFAKERGIALRPHAKTHKSADIARKQLAAGALGICTSKVSEAEALMAAGIDRICMTTTNPSPSKIRRAMALRASVRADPFDGARTAVPGGDQLSGRLGLDCAGGGPPAALCALGLQAPALGASRRQPGPAAGLIRTGQIG